MDAKQRMLDQLRRDKEEKFGKKFGEATAPTEAAA